MEDVVRVKDQTPEPRVDELFGVADFQDYYAEVLRGWHMTPYSYGAGTTIVELEKDAALSMADVLFNDCFVSFSLYSSGRSVWPAKEPSLTGRVAEQSQMIYYLDSQRMIHTHQETDFVNICVDLSIENYFERELLRRFARFEDVVAIYGDRYLREDLVYILLCWEHYDPERMRTLLAVELEMVKKFSERSLSFRYMPLLDQEPSDLMHATSRRIFAR